MNKFLDDRFLYANHRFLINQYLYVLRLIELDCSAKRKSKARRKEILKYTDYGLHHLAEIRFVY